MRRRRGVGSGTRLDEAVVLRVLRTWSKSTVVASMTMLCGCMAVRSSRTDIRHHLVSNPDRRNDHIEWYIGIRATLPLEELYWKQTTVLPFKTNQCFFLVSSNPSKTLRAISSRRR